MALTIIDIARGLESAQAGSLVVEDAVDAAVGVVEPKLSAGRAAARATALAARERAAHLAVLVLAFDAQDIFPGAAAHLTRCIENDRPRGTWAQRETPMVYSGRCRGFIPTNSGLAARR